jgi:bifunctional UDP-N-acetylglucosamine pyrophosphorylase/glucosamine-1-phosphate N-acetyltransferase
MADTYGLVILAAGEGKRLRLPVPKPLAPLMGRTLLDYALDVSGEFLSSKSGQVTVVVGHQRDMVGAHLIKKAPKVASVIQEKQLGTADALRAYFHGNLKANDYAYTFVLCADTPLLQLGDLERLLNVLKTENADAVCATFLDSNPTGYGRIVRAKQNPGFHIVEEKDADEETKKITEVNSGFYVFKTSYLAKHLAQVNSQNKAHEFYLTDVFSDERKVSAVTFASKEHFMGVNDLAQLRQAENILRARKLTELEDAGVRIIDPANTYIDQEVQVGSGSTIHPGCHLRGKTTVGSACELWPGVILVDSIIEDGASVLSYSHLEGAVLKSGASAGPFARLRPGAELGERVKVGNFVEIKKAKLHPGSKVSHLSYVGDAEIGENTNIGCGFITCNYDGAQKHQTKIGKDCFIGSDSQMVAPVTIGDNCYVASGSTINQDLPNGAFAIARTRQVIKEGLAKRFIKKKS